MKNPLIHERKKLLNTVERFLEPVMVFLGFVWLLLLIVEIVWGLHKLLEYLSLSIWAIFIIDFFLKLVLAPDKKLFFKKQWFTAISLVIPALRVFRVFRIFRLIRGLRGVRLIRVVSSLNRSMNSLAKTMSRRGFGYIIILTVLISFGGAAGMLFLEKGNPGFGSYGAALWWTGMRVITAGSEHFPMTSEGRGLAFLLAVYGYAVFGYVTATIATFFIGRDAEESKTPIAGSKDILRLNDQVKQLSVNVNELMVMLKTKDGNKSGNY